MSDWSSGYVTEVGYTHGFYRELLPHQLAFAALTKGYNVRGLPGEGLRVLELGCGQGLSANLIAAGNPHADYVAVDFNPAHIAGAAQLAAEANLTNIRFVEASFEDVANDDSLGKFEMINLHGIYTWVSAENRAHIVKIARDKLKSGGLLYVSYNCFPGWGQVLPIRRLFTDTAHANPAVPIFDRLAEGFEIFEKLKQLKARYLLSSPGLVERIEKTRSLQRNYVAHEYLNGEWTIFHSPDVAADMAEAKLTFVGSANLLDNVDILNLTPEQVEFLATVKDPQRREWLKDLIINQGFRRDIFVRGAPQLQAISWQEKWMDLRFVLAGHAADVPRKVKGMLGEADLQAEVHDPILARLDSGAKSVRELLSDPAIARLGLHKLFQALNIMVGQGHCYIALPAASEAERTKRADAMNGAIIRRARDSADLAFLVSPVSGCGLQADRLAQLFLLAARQKTPDRAILVWQWLSAVGQKLAVDGRALETEEENIADLRGRLDKFDKGQGRVFATLKIR